MPISALAVTVARVRCFKNGTEIGAASGFFYVQADRLYLITNRHVVIEEEDDYSPDELRLRLHVNPDDIRQNGEHPVSLYNNQRPLWLEHPVRRGGEVDVVAIPLDTARITSKFYVKAFSAADHIPLDVDIPIGEDVLVIGYPFGGSRHSTQHADSEKCCHRFRLSCAISRQAYALDRCSPSQGHKW